MKLFGSIFFSLIFLSSMAQDKAAYRIFNAKGKEVSYKKAFKSIESADMLFFGELHNDPIAHWLEFELLKDLAEKKGSENVVLGAEMFEADQQEVVDDYLAGTITQDTFLNRLRAWPNYKTDYKPVVEYCKQHKIPLIATNVPRKYARMVASAGPDVLQDLSDEEKAVITPLPYPIPYDNPSYDGMREMLGHGGSMKADNFIAAQAVKDATMAHFILENRPNTENGIFLHLNGSYHSDSKEGIIWYVWNGNSEIEIVNLTVVLQTDTQKLDKEYKGKADFIIVVPESMTKTY